METKLYFPQTKFSQYQFNRWGGVHQLHYYHRNWCEEMMHSNISVILLYIVPKYLYYEYETYIIDLKLELTWSPSNDTVSGPWIDVTYLDFLFVIFFWLFFSSRFSCKTLNGIWIHVFVLLFHGQWHVKHQDSACFSFMITLCIIWLYKFFFFFLFPFTCHLGL